MTGHGIGSGWEFPAAITDVVQTDGKLFAKLSDGHLWMLSDHRSPAVRVS